ncbi:hypothetical protein B0H11DRAFT_2331992 [Mycena galericulata]|nr:hypothetical protein B0H11DRAFT_2331992 [Mycena galericulata]
MLDALALAGRVDDLNRIFLVLSDCAVKDGLRVCDANRELVYVANVQHLPWLDDAKATETGALLVTHVMGPWMNEAVEIVKSVTGVVRVVAERLIAARSTLEHGVALEPAHAVRVLQAYAEVPGMNGLPKDMDDRDWAFYSLVSLLKDMRGLGVRLADVLSRAVRKVVKSLFVKQAADELRTLFGRLGFEGVLELLCVHRQYPRTPNANNQDVSSLIDS